MGCTVAERDWEEEGVAPPSDGESWELPVDQGGVCDMEGEVDGVAVGNRERVGSVVMDALMEALGLCVGAVVPDPIPSLGVGVVSGVIERVGNREGVGRAVAEG